MRSRPRFFRLFSAHSTIHDAGEDCRERRVGLRRPVVRLGRHLGRDVDLAGVRARELADEPLGVAVAVDQRGVDEVDAVIEGALERGARIGVARGRPTCRRRWPRRRS